MDCSNSTGKLIIHQVSPHPVTSIISKFSAFLTASNNKLTPEGQGYVKGGNCEGEFKVSRAKFLKEICIKKKLNHTKLYLATIGRHGNSFQDFNFGDCETIAFPCLKLEDFIFSSA